MASETTIPFAEGKTLLINKHIIEYTENGCRLQYYAVCVAPMVSEQSRCPPDSLTLIFTHGLSLGEYLMLSGTGFQ